MRTSILEISNLVKSYPGGSRVLDGVNFSVRKGSICGFLGLNGAGKSTTIRILAGLTSRDSGDITFDGKSIDDHRDFFKQRAGFVLDSPLYFDWMSGEEYLSFVGMMYGLRGQEGEKRIDELLEFFDLESVAEDPISTYSSGLKKKISLSAAMIHAPELLVLDEPLESIDPLALRSIKDSLLLMARKGGTVLITSHILDSIERLCDDVAIIHRGTVILESSVDNVKKKVKNGISNEKFSSLEELFVDLVAQKGSRQKLSWL